MTFYSIILAAHNLMRWVVVILAIYALVRVYMGWFGNKDFTESDRKSLSWYSIGLDIQLLLGLLLYFVLSPITTTAFRNFGPAMSDSGVRFFLVEHSLLMIIAVVLGHVAVAAARRGTVASSKFRRGAIWLTLSVLCVLLAIPWATRPLLPHLGMLMQFFA